MEYVNPVSIAQMANVPKDTSLPGTGYGLMQGFNEGEAMNRSRDFLNMAQASQAQDYAKNQFKMQTDWENYPLERMAKQQGLEKGQQDLSKSKYDLKLLQEKAKKEGVFEHMRLAGGAADAFRNAKTPLEKRAVYEQMRKAHEMSGIPVDEDLHYSPGDPNSEAQVQHYLDTARDIVAYSPDTLGNIAANKPKIDATVSEGAADRASKEKMNKEDNDVRLKIANITAAAHMAASQGTNSWGAFRTQLGNAWVAVQKKPQKDWTAEDKAVADVASKVLAPSPWMGENITGNVGVQRDIAGAKAGGALSETLNTMQNMNNPTIKPLPNQTPIQGESLKGPSIEDRLNRYK